ncbi:MAG: dihydroorotase [Kiritimatiellae bacterium]|jgi:dihydroorotase|nr:dihydroorotase [Kiritimatiellia bacterium]
MAKLILKNAKLVDPQSGEITQDDLYISDDKIIEKPEFDIGFESIDLSDKTILPGFIDLHVHFREPGKEEAETIETGTASATAGGFTSVLLMGNTTPAMDSPKQIEFIKEKSKNMPLDIMTVGCLTMNRDGKQIAPLRELAEAGVPAFSDDGSTTVDTGLMTEAAYIAAELNKPIVEHALHPELAGNGVIHKGVVSAKLGVPGISSKAEAVIIERDILLSEKTNAHIHIQHISTAEGVSLIRDAKKSGIKVSAELTPHHLALCDEDIPGNNANYKMNPPIRSAKDRECLVQGVLDGTIETLATDHAPHTAVEKAKGLIGGPFGITGLETAIGITYKLLVANKLMSVSQWAKLWTVNPAKILKLKYSQNLYNGSLANLTIVDENMDWMISDASQFKSKSKNSPFIKYPMTCKPYATIYKGSYRKW